MGWGGVEMLQPGPPSLSASVFPAWTGEELAGGTRGIPAGAQRLDRLAGPPDPLDPAPVVRSPSDFM